MYTTFSTLKFIISIYENRNQKSQKNVLIIMFVVAGTVVGLQNWESKHIYCAGHVLELTTIGISILRWSLQLKK